MHSDRILVTSENSEKNEKCGSEKTEALTLVSSTTLMSYFECHPMPKCGSHPVRLLRNVVDTKAMKARQQLMKA